MGTILTPLCTPRCPVRICRRPAAACRRRNSRRNRRGSSPASCDTERRSTRWSRRRRPSDAIRYLVGGADPGIEARAGVHHRRADLPLGNIRQLLVGDAQVLVRAVKKLVIGILRQDGTPGVIGRRIIPALSMLSRSILSQITYFARARIAAADDIVIGRPAAGSRSCRAATAGRPGAAGRGCTGSARGCAA